MNTENYKRKIAETFNGRSDYNKDNFHGSLAERVVALARPRWGDFVLDVATGTGLAAIETARLVGPSGKVIGVDISDGMLKKAKRALDSEALENVELVNADVEEFSYPSNTFDLIICVSAIPYLTDIKRAMESWIEMLKPGGRLVFNSWSEMSYVTGYLMREIATRNGIKFSASADETSSWERIKSMLQNVGFQASELIAEPRGAHFVSMEKIEKAWHNWFVSPIFHTIESKDADRLALLKDDYLREARIHQTEKGVWDEMIAYFVVGTK